MWGSIKNWPSIIQVAWAVSEGSDSSAVRVKSSEHLVQTGAVCISGLHEQDKELAYYLLHEEACRYLLQGQNLAPSVLLQRQVPSLLPDNGAIKNTPMSHFICDLASLLQCNGPYYGVECLTHNHGLP